MCRLLKINRSTVYVESTQSKQVDEMEEKIVEIFYRSHSIYGSRKIQAELRKQGFFLSRRRISRIMSENNLVSVYTKAQFKPQPPQVNEDPVTNKVNRHFNQREKLQVVVSDLTYVRVNGGWNYVCVLLDLHAREIIGYSCGPRKTAQLVYEAFASVKQPLSRIEYFHTDRGSEFKSYEISDLLDAFGIQRSLSAKGNPYDNAVAEATFKIIKTEFIRNNSFRSLSELKEQLSTYIHWFNHHRIHSTLGYLSPIQYQTKLTKQFV
jgi:putative transposase